MKKLFLASVLGVTPFLGGTNMFAQENVCTLEYRPVCGSVQVQCIKAPCEPIRQTFGNACAAANADAVDVTVGACAADVLAERVTWAYDLGLTKYDTVEKFGTDRALSREEAGAIFARLGSQDAFSHLRYASYPDQCNVKYNDETSFDITLKDDVYSACALGLMRGQNGSFSPKSTLSRAEALAVLMRAVDGKYADESGKIWYQRYLDRAEEIKLSISTKQTFDAPITRGELLEWLESGFNFAQEQQLKKSDVSLLGKWNLVSFSGTKVESGMTIDFEVGRFSAKICNSMGGTYTVDAGKIISGPAMSTMMYCEGRMDIESALDLDQATYVIALADGNSTVDTLEIKTVSGVLFSFTR